ncbi:MAG: radical SAM protein [Eubacteriaceae bacterium]|nr:radical SAM protein [Eubacteriaceae bacterium]
MERYGRITEKHPREIVLLKAFPCKWGKCTFCDYIADNETDEQAIVELDSAVLAKVRGDMGVLEVIDSASCFDLPEQTLDEIHDLIHAKNIERLFLESHWMYRHRLEEMRERMGVPITFKIGVETFDNDFRENYLNKNAGFTSPAEVAEYFDSPCLMVGIKGQTREMIRRDIDILKKYFRLGTINMFTDNTTPVKRDRELAEWFLDEFGWLLQDPDIEVLIENTDFGVGD